MYTISPASGAIPPGNAVLVNVECVADAVGVCEELLGIEITDRDTRKYKLAVPYKLSVESCLPAIEVNNFASVFEEHRICDSLVNRPASSAIQNGHDFVAGVYFQQENCFQFDGVLVGNTVKARLRLNNPTRVPADVTCSIKLAGSVATAAGNQSGRISSRSATAMAAQNAASALSDSFEISPSRLQIKPLSYETVVLSFQPQALQSYEAIFEALLENVPPGMLNPVPTGAASVQSESKSRLGSPPYFISSQETADNNSSDVRQGVRMNFKIVGKGQLPHFALLQPSLKKPTGEAVCVFKRLKLGKSAREPLVIANNGHLPATVS
ncbi:hypothetical protein Ciccas_014293 [Cichlidogyrus casuarinus]|uniref:Uncharacterized protein n=1 Tax=Cichlidogyrus casuarinus TaxID=1844966 RepID=A0ABD2PIJ7_9PLAT